MSKVDLVVIGNLLLDDLPQGVDIPGGAALFTALAARCCGLSVAVHSVVGEDYPLRWLEETGVRLSLRRLSGPGGRTVIRYTPQGRTLRHVGPCHRELSPQVPHPFEASLVHIAPMPTDIQAFHLSHCAPGSALLDPYPVLDATSWARFQPFQDRLAALLLNEEEMHLKLDAVGKTVWAVLKQAERGGMTANPNLRWKAAPAQVVDLTGAGDAFAAGLAAGLLSGKGHQAALDQGARAAAWALTDIGAEGLYRHAKLVNGWEITRSHLEAARGRLTPTAAPCEDGWSLERYAEWLAHNELELAFDELEGLALETASGPEVWADLARAAQSMGLEERAVRCLSRGEGSLSREI